MVVNNPIKTYGLGKGFADDLTFVEKNILINII